MQNKVSDNIRAATRSVREISLPKLRGRFALNSFAKYSSPEQVGAVLMALQVVAGSLVNLSQVPLVAVNCDVANAWV